MSLLFSGLYLFTAGVKTSQEDPPKIENLKFGEITIDGTMYDHDVVIKDGQIRKRKKGPSKVYRSKYGHTPLTTKEEIPWDCKVMVIGIGMSGKLPVTKHFKKMAKKKGVKLVLLKTRDAVKYFTENYSDDMNAIFHITC